MVEAWIAGAVLGYGLGSIPVGLWVGRLQGVDVRQGGSGKIGATNTYRRLGLRWSLLVFALDVTKGAVAVALLQVAFTSPTGEVIAAVAAIGGHIFPLFAGFRGGRAAATGFGALLLLTPPAAGVGIALGAVLLGITRIMSLSVLLGIAVAAMTQGLLVAYGDEPTAYYGFAVGAWALITLAHRDNIRRLAAGTERVLGQPARPRSLPEDGATAATGVPAAGTSAGTAGRTVTGSTGGRMGPAGR